MDFDSLKTQVSNLTLYDLKAGVRKVQNAVMNLTEMESKVREATNGDAWGASATLMQEISAGTHNYQQLSEIMPMIYKRFTDKTAEEWRQIYKALQLLEFLVKNGSERVVDDARSHLSLLRMLRQFHYIDQNGKDQGINVRNRSIELVKLLGDVDQIRAERKKARANKTKYGGVEGGAGLGGSGFSSGARYGGFGSESTEYGTYQGRVFGDGGGFGGQETDYSETQRRGEQFEEYDEEEDGGSRPVARASAARTAPAAAAAKKAPAKAKQPEPDLFDFGDEPVVSSTNGKAPAASSSGGFGALSSPPANLVADEDDFDDFQSATSPSVAPPSSSSFAALSSPPTISTTTSNTQFAAPKPLAAGQTASFNNLFATPSPAPSATSSMAPQIGSTISTPPLQSQGKPFQAAGTYKPSGPNYYTSVSASLNNPSATKSAFSPPLANTSAGGFTSSTSAANLGKPAPKPAAVGGGGGGGGDAFSSIWSTASNKSGVQSKTGGNKGPDLASLAKAKSEAGIWGAPAATGASLAPRPGAIAPSPNTAAQGKPATSLGNGLDDLLG